jgi:hypothetical protein
MIKRLFFLDKKEKKKDIRIGASINDMFSLFFLLTLTLNSFFQRMQLQKGITCSFFSHHLYETHSLVNMIDHLL